MPKKTKKNPNGVNQEAMLAVADVIEYMDRFDLGSWTKDVAENALVNDMDKVWKDCGTTACVAGWVCAWAETKPKTNMYGEVGIPYEEEGAKELGLTERQAGQLFFNYDTSVWGQNASDYGWKLNEHYGCVKDLRDITAFQAADVLRRVAIGDIMLLTDAELEV